MSYIYEPTGRAREYAPLALNLFTGCPHGCTYCYARRRWHTTGDDPVPRIDTEQGWDRLKREAEALSGDPRPVFLCFTCDPLPRNAQSDVESTTELAVVTLLGAGMRVRLLSKGGYFPSWLARQAERNPGRIEFGQSLTYTSAVDVVRYEEGAALFRDRLRALILAKLSGCRTFVSVEPLVDVDGLLLELTDAGGCGCCAVKYIDRFNVGGAPNYWRDGKPVRSGELATLLAALKRTGAAVGLKRDAWDVLCEFGAATGWAHDVVEATGCERLWEVLS